MAVAVSKKREDPREHLRREGGGFRPQMGRPAGGGGTSTSGGSPQPPNGTAARGPHHAQINDSSSVDIDEIIEKSGCAAQYHKLEDCLAEHDRDWRSCQGEVKSLKLCRDSKES